MQEIFSTFLFWCYGLIFSSSSDISCNTVMKPYSHPSDHLFISFTSDIMETLQAIKTRRSIRKYTDQPISEKDVQTILEAAMQAPSAMNEQLRHFVVINDKDLLSKIPSLHPRAAMTAECNVALLICADLSRQATEGFRVHDCSIAAENILLAAHDLGLG